MNEVDRQKLGSVSSIGSIDIQNLLNKDKNRKSGDQKKYRDSDASSVSKSLKYVQDSK